MSSHSTTSPSLSATRWKWIRDLSFFRSMRKWGPLSFTAVWISIGMLTRPKLSDPDQSARAMSLEPATNVRSGAQNAREIKVELRVARERGILFTGMADDDVNEEC